MSRLDRQKAIILKVMKTKGIDDAQRVSMFIQELNLSHTDALKLMQALNERKELLETTMKKHKVGLGHARHIIKFHRKRNGSPNLNISL